VKATPIKSDYGSKDCVDLASSTAETGIIGVILIGFVVGLIARALMPGRDIAGFILTSLLGIGGAVVGQYTGQALGLYLPQEPAGFIMSVIGAMLILLLFHLFRSNQNS